MDEGTNTILPKTKGIEQLLSCMNLISAIMYLYQGTRPDINFAINVLSRFINCYITIYWNAAKNILRYLKATSQNKITYGPKFTNIVCYSDAGFQFIYL